MHLAAINVPFTDVQVDHAMAHPIPLQMLALSFAVATVWIVLFLFSLVDTMSMITKKNLKCRQHTFPLCVSLFQMSLGTGFFLHVGIITLHL